MKEQRLSKSKPLKGELIVPADKSISHRSVIFASIAKGKSIIKNFLKAEDPLSTLNAMKALGVEVGEIRTSLQNLDHYTELIINGKGLKGLKEPFDVINCGNSGTTMRLLSGILASIPCFSVLTGDDSLKQRPMARIIQPLKQMGASIFGRSNDSFPPFAIKGNNLKAIDYEMPVASAQVKSCLMLAGLFAEGTTIISEPFKSRDHSERMLSAMGASIDIEGLTIRVTGNTPNNHSLKPLEVTVPSDFSSAAFFIVAALLIPNSEILIRNVGINPTRTGLLSILKTMGASVKLENVRDMSGEPVADIHCISCDKLKPFKIGRDIMPTLIDEFPILCVLASQAEGISDIRGAEELRIKESDRIRSMVTELRKMGVEIDEYPDGVTIKGKAKLKGAPLESYRDHRIAMSLSIAGLIAEGETVINNPECVDVSFPNFYHKFKQLQDNQKIAR